MIVKLRLIAILGFALILVNFCTVSAQQWGVELGVQDIEIYPLNPSPTDSIEVEVLVTISESLPDSLLPKNVHVDVFLNDMPAGAASISIEKEMGGTCPQNQAQCISQQCSRRWNGKVYNGTCEWQRVYILDPETGTFYDTWICVCEIAKRLKPFKFWLGDFTVEDSFAVTVKIDPDDEFLEIDETDNEITEQFTTSGAIPTLTEWGLIIFGVVLLGFITWVFLRRRKVIGVRL